MTLKKKNPEIEQAMMLRWIQHLREAEDMMLELGAKKAGERVASFLIRWCGDQGEWQELPLSRSEMGELLGLTIETVSRFLSDWKRKELIDEHRGRIRVMDVQALRDHVCMSGSC
jgi:CRP/FNR family transcriptional regulator